MWLVRDVERRRNAEASHLRVDELVADGRVVSSTIELARWGEPEVHLDACTYCGGDDLPGSWVALRRVGDRVVFLPAFTWLEAQLSAEDREGTGSWVLSEYAPPPYTAELGVAMFDEVALRAVLPELPKLIAPLDRREVARLLQLELAPLLGTFPRPAQPDRARFVAGPGASLDADLTELDRTLSEWVSCPGGLRVRPRHDDDALLWFHADDRDLYPLVRSGAGAPHLHFEPGLVFERL